MHLALRIFSMAVEVVAKYKKVNLGKVRCI